MIDAISKSFFHALASSAALKRMASSYGMRKPTSFARRFIAGETIEEALVASRAVEAQGLKLTLDQLGESVATLDEARAATQGYVRIIETIVASGIERNISLKLTQLGLDLDRAHTVDNLRRILDLAQQHDFFVRVDMEDSPYTDATLDMVETMWQHGFRNVGTVLQSCLFRSEKDLARLNALGMRVRLVKGAYREPREVAFQQKADVDAAFARMTGTLLREGNYPAIATHDEAMIGVANALAAKASIPQDRYEFQMLYGIRRDLQARLMREGYRVRVYVPFGTQWFPYFMRRLGERPANVGFVLKGVLKG